AADGGEGTECRRLHRTAQSRPGRVLDADAARRADDGAIHLIVGIPNRQPTTATVRMLRRVARRRRFGDVELQWLVGGRGVAVRNHGRKGCPRYTNETILAASTA